VKAKEGEAEGLVTRAAEECLASISQLSDV